MIYYFQKDLKPTIKIKIEQQDRVLTSFKEIVQKTIYTEAKASLMSNIMVRDANFHCLRGYHPSQNTFAKVQTQDSTVKKSKLEESRPKDSKPANGKTLAPLCINEPEKTFRQDEKKEYLKKK